jgi:hypothetical protein
MRSKLYSFIIIGTVVGMGVLLSACSNRPGGAGGGGGGGGTLTTEEKATVDTVMKQLDATVMAVGGAVEGFSSVDLTADDRFGTCPVVVFSLNNNVASISLTFTDGCQNDYYGDVALSGGIAITFDANVGSFNATFDNFTVGSELTDGSLDVQRSTDANQIRTWTGMIDIHTTGVGSAVGDLSVKIDPVRQTMTIETADLTLSEEGGSTHSVNTDGLVIKPVANQSFIPEAGTVTYVVSSSDPAGPATITIKFDANSPKDRTVSVTVSGGTTTDYQLPGL